MAGLVYYAPEGLDLLTADGLAAAGLGYALGDRPPTCRGVANGPGDRPGVVAARPGSIGDHLVGYWPERQRWHRIPGPAGCWVGVGTEARPAPDDLARRDLLPGHWVELADGQRWLIPCARAARETDDGLTFDLQLPRRISIDPETGEWLGGQVVDRYADLWAVACRWWDAVMATMVQVADQPDGDQPAGDELEITFSDELDGALTALAANYRVGKAEVSLLGLLDGRVVPELLGALVDWPTVQQWNKKKRATAG